MTTAQLLRTLREVPFQPFAMYLADGQHLDVLHPEVVTLAGGGRIANVMNREGLFDVVDVLMIVSLRPIGRQRIRDPKR